MVRKAAPASAARAIAAAAPIAALSQSKPSSVAGELGTVTGSLDEAPVIELSDE
jgi:hypothetical protein